MKLRTMAGAFLTYGDEVLLIKRGLHKKLAPGMWSCIGGHMEAGELNNPAAACYREIAEETGIPQESIDNLRLRYITARNTDNEIRTGYYFTGDTAERFELPECEEGTLHWVRITDMINLPMSFSVKQISEHWASNRDCDAVLLCGINRSNNEMTRVEL